MSRHDGVSKVAAHLRHDVPASSSHFVSRAPRPTPPCDVVNADTEDLNLAKKKKK
eukprot:GDKH01001039.1.p2 GENE.GDKH01001039.1~~GDKH01001039.1.p2  ORF type:complete len:55 (-),score=9.07 GDKH01001039.1:45-209(-)